MRELEQDHRVEAKLFFREPGILARRSAAAVDRPAGHRRHLRAARAGSAARRTTLHRPVRPIDAWSSPWPRWASTRCRLGWSSTARRASCVGSPRRRSSRRPLAGRPARRQHGRRDRRDRRAHRRRPPGLPDPRAAGLDRFRRRVPARACPRCSPWACSSRRSRRRAGAARPCTLPLFVAVMFLGGVYLPRVVLPEFLVRIGDVHAARRASDAGRLVGTAATAGPCWR